MQWYRIHMLRLNEVSTQIEISILLRRMEHIIFPYMAAKIEYILRRPGQNTSPENPNMSF